MGGRERKIPVIEKRPMQHQLCFSEHQGSCLCKTRNQLLCQGGPEIPGNKTFAGRSKKTKLVGRKNLDRMEEQAGVPCFQKEKLRQSWDAVVRFLPVS